MRDLSTAAVQAIYGQESGGVWLYLLTIEHSSMTTVRIVNDTVDIDSRGNTFTASSFQITIPPQKDRELPAVDLVMDNIGLELMVGIRSLDGQPTITLELVLASDPDTVEVGPYVFSLKDVQYDAFQIRGQISFESLLTEPFNFRKFTPQDFPGLFTVVR